MDRDTILEGEREYLDALDDKRRPLEDRLFGDGFRDEVLARGFLLPGELAEIAYWKWYGAAPTVQSANSPELIRRFSAAAISRHSDPRLAAWILKYLHGVNVRMASAVMAVLFPDEYTVMDVRAWSALEALGWRPDLEQVFGDQPVPGDFLDRCSVYEVYLDECRKRAAEYDVSLRSLDRFLYVQGVAAA